MRQLFGILILAAIIAAGVAWQRQQQPADPLRAEKLELQRAEILRETEREKQRTEAEKRETALTLAAIDRRARLESNTGVTFASVALAVTWRLTFPLLLFSGLIGAGVYLYRKPVLFEFEGVKAFLPRYAVPEVTQQALAVQERKAMVEAFAYAESVTKERVDQMIDAVKALKPGRETVNISNAPALPAATQQAVNVPTFAELFSAGEIGEGQPLFMGVTRDGKPQRRTIADLKAVSVAGQQGAGKTASMAYLITSTLLMSDEAEAYVIDPHWKHPEGLGAMIQPLEQTGRLHLINPIDLAATIDALDARLDRRLAGQESSAAPVVFAADELAKLAKSPMFAEKLLPFVERFTEETRKVNFVGLFGSQKWNARHFGNKADIRATIPSLLVHKIKPSQADLLLEDKENAKLMKRVSLPGQALMATSHDADPSVITVPLITRKDVEDVARMLSVNLRETTQPLGRGDVETDGTIKETPEPFDASEAKIDNVIPFPKRDTSTMLTQLTPQETQADATDNTGDTSDTTLLTAALESCGNDKKVLAERSGVSVSLIKEMQAGRRRITDDTRQKLERVLHDTTTQEA